MVGREITSVEVEVELFWEKARRTRVGKRTKLYNVSCNKRGNKLKKYLDVVRAGKNMKYVARLILALKRLPGPKGSTYGELCTRFDVSTSFRRYLIKLYLRGQTFPRLKINSRNMTRSDEIL